MPAKYRIRAGGQVQDFDTWGEADTFRGGAGFDIFHVNPDTGEETVVTGEVLDGGGGGGGGAGATTTGTGEAITSSLADQYLKFLQSRTYGTGLTRQGTAGFGQLTPTARSQVAGRFQPRRTEFNLFGPGRGITTDEETDEVFAPMGTFGEFLGARSTAGTGGGYRTQGDINARVQNLRRLLADPTGGVGQSGFTANQGMMMRGLFADDPTRQMNAALLGAGRGVSPYFRDAMRQGAEANYANFRANNPGVSWLDYANQVGLLGTPVVGSMYDPSLV